MYIKINHIQDQVQKEIKMKTTQKQAYNRLLKKLSALRATLSNEERAILDSMVSADEVKAHKLNSKAANRATGKAKDKAIQVQAHKLNSKAAQRAVGKAKDKAIEVQAHKLTDKAVGKAVGKTAAKSTEVQAHKLNSKASEKAANKAKDKAAARIAFDPNSEEYKITD